MQSCVLFANNNVGKWSPQKLEALFTERFTKWKDAVEQFIKHLNYEYHKLSIVCADEFIKVMDYKKYYFKWNRYFTKKKQVLQNQAKLVPIIQVII